MASLLHIFSDPQSNNDAQKFLDVCVRSNSWNVGMVSVTQKVQIVAQTRMERALYLAEKNNLGHLSTIHQRRLLALCTHFGGEDAAADLDAAVGSELDRKKAAVAKYERLLREAKEERATVLGQDVADAEEANKILQQRVRVWNGLKDGALPRWSQKMISWCRDPDYGKEQLSELNRTIGSHSGNLKTAEGALKFFEGALERATSGGVSEEDRECPICMEEMSNEDMAITACGHLFHFDCVSDTIRAQKRCPTCRNNLGEHQISLCKDMMQGAGVEDLEKKQFGSKIVAIRDVLRKIHAESDDSSIIFIQFASIVESMRKALEKVGIKAFVLEGQVGTRTRILDQFKQTPKSVLLLSLEHSPSGT